MSFSDYSYAARARDVMRRIAEDTVRRMRPEPMVGEVYDFNAENLVADIRFRGHNSEQLLRVKVSSDRIPTSSIRSPNGDVNIVRVSGRAGSYYISDFIKGQSSNPRYEV